MATGGGTHTLSVMRFMQDKVTIHKGGTVEWTSADVITPHTITFGVEPLDVFDPSANVTVDTDGARHGVINSTSDSVHSGFIQAAPQDRIGLAQSPLGVTRFRVTFTKPGVYPFICALHDELGMTERSPFFRDPRATFSLVLMGQTRPSQTSRNPGCTPGS